MLIRPRVTTTLMLTCTMAAAMGLAAGASAQCNIPENVVSAQSIDDAGRQAIRACVVLSQQAFGKDEASVESARKQLLRPFQSNAAPSLEFRFAFEKEAIGFLRSAATGKSEFAAINAVVVAGHVGTINAQSLLVDRLKDERAAVRLAAAEGLAGSFRALAQSGPKAVSEREVGPAWAALASRIKDEPDPLVLLACVSALDAASRVPAGGAGGDFPTLASDAALASATSVGDRANAQPNSTPMHLATLQASRTVLDVLTAGSAQPPLNTAARIMFARFVGDCLSMTQRRVTAASAGGLPSDERAAYVELTKRCENILQLIGIDGYKPGPSVGLSDLLAKDDDRTFLAKVGLVVGDGGTLTKAPFSIPADRWAQK